MTGSDRPANVRELVRKLSLAVDQSPASVIIADTSGTIEYVNQRFTQVTGYAAHEAIGQTPRLLKSGRNSAQLYGEMWKALKAGRTWRGELINRRKSGELYWDSVRIAPMRDADGTITHFVATQEDITDRRRAEEALRESEERFRQLAENSKALFFIRELPTGQTIYLSPAYEEIWGRSCESGYATPGAWLEGVHPDDRAALALAEREVEARQLLWHVFRVVRPDGSTRWVRSRAFPVRDATGVVYRVAGVAEDFTELRHTEQQLQQSQKMEAVGRLAGGIAHDFNNLLTVITSYTDLLLEDFAPADPRREDLEQIRRAASGAASLTRQLLAFSRQQLIEPRVVVLEDVVTHAERMLRRLIGEDVELITVLSDPPSRILIDPGQLEQVILNLAVNARDAMPTGGTLTIETTVVDVGEDYAETHAAISPGRYAMLALTDTGVGMDDATRARIFEPFFTTKELGKGTGLGLATVYGIVKQSGGFIWAYSEPGLGATFKIYLPLTDQPTSAEPGVAPPDHSLRGSETVMLVEDADAVRRVARQILERHGYGVLAAASGPEALVLARQQSGPIHLLLTDVVMPEMSGRQLAEHFASLWPEAKVLFMSGYTNDAVLRHGLHPGATYLQKPFSPDSLARKVRDVLDARGAS